MAKGIARADLGSLSSGMVLTISPRTFEQIEQFILNNKRSELRCKIGLDLLTRTMAYAIKGYAQAKSAGPVAPRHRSVSALAGRIPVQRITGRYFAGWQTQRIGSGWWRVTNTSKEAYLIEYGIHQRVRRPILKMSVISMLQMVAYTRTGKRFLQETLGPRNSPATGRFVTFSSRVGSDVLGIAGPTGNLP